MRNIKLILVFLASIFVFQSYGQEKELEALFYFKGNRADDVKFYLIKGDDAYIQKYQQGKITFSDTLPNDFQLLAVYKKHQALIPVTRFNEVSYINVYYDNRIFNNSIRKKYGRPFFKHLFKKDYLIDLGLDDVYTTFKLKKKYNLIN